MADRVTVGGTYASGLIISAMTPEHLSPGQPKVMYLVLTPDAAKELYRKLHAMSCQSDGGYRE